MALTNATTLADYSAGIGTQGAALTVDATNKRVGVGTDAPAGPEGSLQVGTGITFFGNTGIVSAIGGRFSGDFNVAGALTFEDVTNIDSLGFGTFRSGLTVQGAGSTTTTLSVTGVSTFAGNVSIADSIFHTADIDTSIRFPAADTFTVETGGSERLRVNSSGQLGIGANNNSDYDSNARNLLLASSGSTGITIRSGGSSDFALIHFADGTSGSAEQRAGRILYGHSDNFMSFHCANTERLRLTSNGTLLVGATAAVGEGGTPADLNSAEIGRGFINLSRDDTAAADHILFGKNGSIASSVGTDTSNSIVFKTGTTEAARFDSSQRLLIGTTSLINSSTASNFQIANASGPRLCIARNDTSTASGNLIGALDFYGNDSDGTYENCARILAEADADHTTDSKLTRLTFYTAGSDPDVPEERLRIGSDGHILPGADATQNLGSTSKRWANIYSADLQLSNEGSANDVDGTWGNYTIQEGENDLFLLNRRNGKTYKFVLEEVN